MIVFIIAITAMHLDYGPMKARELAAMSTGDLGAADTAETESANANPRGRVIDLVLPVVVLIVSCTLGLAYVGGFFSDDPAVAGNFVEAFGNTDAFAALPWGALIALVFTIIYIIARRLASFKDAMNCVTRGFYNMVPAMIILTFACALKNMTVMLGAKYYVAGLMGSAAAALFNLLPAIIFVVACVLSFSTGTSWGTFGILVPIVTYVFPADSTLYIIGISACLAGAVFGDHCSPISDTSIMASAGAQCDHVTHVSTQMPYALTVGAVCFLSYLVAGFVQNWLLSFVIALVLLFVTLFVLRSRGGKTQAA
jgi:Na+/H+ antiporter NhaC